MQSFNIERYNDLTRITGITKDELDINKTLKCGQAFRWKKLSDFGDSTWQGVIDNEIVILSQGIFKDGKEGITTNLNIEDINKLINYLNLDMSYTDEINKLNLIGYAKESYEKGKGIHILRQDLFEIMVTFLMSQFNSMKNIANIVEKLAKRYGNRTEIQIGGQKIVRYSFPTLDELSKADYEGLRQCSVGLRTNYLLSMLDRLSKNPSILDTLHESDYATSMKILKSFNGIGDKVANCICLFALHHVEAFPVDLHIQHILDREYNGISPAYQFGQYAGIVQQYMYYNEAFR